jgi:hypothetical protein
MRAALELRALDVHPRLPELLAAHSHLAYLKKYGTPRALDDLHDHLVVHYSLRFGADTPASSIATTTSVANDPCAA